MRSPLRRDFTFENSDRWYASECYGLRLGFMEKGVQLDVMWHDHDLLEVAIAAWNGSFGGAVNVYVAIGELKETADKLKGFPRSPTYKREFVFGQFGRKLGAVSMRFYCADRAGHAYVELKIESGTQIAGVTQSVVLSVYIEPAALDSFVEDLCRLESDKAGTACLHAS